MRVLLVAYDFPPVGGIGVQRVVKFARYLPEHGVDTVVLTNAHGMGLLQDPALLERNKLQSLPVIRRGGELLAPYHRYRAGGSFPWHAVPRLLWSTLCYADLYGLWFSSIRKALPALVREQRIDAVWVTVPHASSCHFGLELGRRCGLPWIADVRDSMVANPDLQVAAGLAQLQAMRMRQLEREVVKHAARICTVSQPIIDNMVARAGEGARSRFVLLPNGFDSADLPAAAASPRNDKLTLIFAGTFLGRRRPDTLVAGINLAVASGQVNPAMLRFEFYGRYAPDVTAMLRGINAAVECNHHGFVPHATAVAATQRADVALIITSPGNHAAAQEVITGKVFECMGLKKRVLALTDAAPLRGLIAEARLGECCSAGDPAAVAAALQSLQARWRDGVSLAVEPDPVVCQRYERHAQAGLLAQVFRDIVTTGVRKGDE